jgi:hypothetical protein
MARGKATNKETDEVKGVQPSTIVQYLGQGRLASAPKRAAYFSSACPGRANARCANEGLAKPQAKAQDRLGSTVEGGRIDAEAGLTYASKYTYPTLQVLCT